MTWLDDQKMEKSPNVEPKYQTSECHNSICPTPIGPGVRSQLFASSGACYKGGCG